MRIERSEQRVMIKNSYLEEHKNVTNSSRDIDLISLSPSEAFERLNTSQARGIPKTGALAGYEPHYISLNAAVVGSEPDRAASEGFVNGREKNDPFFIEQRFACGHLHSCSFRTIRPHGTTGRGIIIHA